MDRIVEVIQQPWGDIQINCSYTDDSEGRKFIRVTLQANDNINIAAALSLNDDGLRALNRALKIAQAFKSCRVTLNGGI